MEPKKIILILIDTLRADHLGCYGYKRNTSPNIDTFAKEGLIFKWPFAPISYTVPSITSLFSGKYPSNHCTMFSNGAPVKSIETDPFLTDILGSEGYETAAFVSSLVIGKVRKVAITSGFKTYNDEMTAHELNRLTELIRSGDRTNEAVFKWLEKNYNTNFFSFIHYFDLHGPYVNPKPYDELFVNDDYYGEPEFINKIVPEDKAIGGIPEYQVLSPKRDEDENLIDFEKDINYYIAQYDGGIRYCDEQIGNLFNELRELGIYDDCLIILTSDHGEALGENNVYFYHGLTVTMDQIHVPVILKPHTNWHPNTNLISAPISLVDLMPTILDLIGYDFSELDIDGVSILDIEKNSNRKIISEIEPQIAHIDKSFIHLKPRDNLDEKKYFPYIKELCSEEKRFNYRKDTNREPMVLEWTGERYLPFVDPEISGAEIHYEHLHRYAFAAQFVKGKKVLDFASGEGYGSYMLSKEAELVIGVEIDEKTVKHASSSYISDNLEFIQGSILKVPIEGEKMFDAIICFEAIEHVENHEKLMKEVKRLLRDDGIFIVSSPNKKVYTDDPDYHNPFHLKELYFDEFKNLLSNYFTNIYFFGQMIYTASNLWRLTSEEVHNYTEFMIKKGDGKFYFSDSNEKVPLYFIAVASNADLNERYNKRSYLVDASNILIGDYKRQINDLNVAIQGKDEQILNLEGQITNISSQLKEKDKQIDDFNVAVQGKDTQIRDFEGEIADFSGLLKEKDKQIRDLEVDITNISEQLSEKKQRIDGLTLDLIAKNAQLKSLETQIADIYGQLNEREEGIRDYEMENVKIYSELHSIKASLTWGTVMKWHWFIDRLMPLGTRRRRSYDLGVIGLRTITNEGWRNFWWKYKQHKSSKQHTEPIAKSTEERILETARDKTEPSNNSLDTFKSYKLLNFLSQPGISLSFPKFKEPVVSIITLTFNKVEFTYQYLESILAHTDIPYELILVDNGSHDETTSLLDRLENVTIIKNNENLGFIMGCNQGACKAKGKYLLFLNNDINVTPEWLSKLVKTIENYPKCGAVGGKLIWPTGKLQEAGSIIWSDGSALGYGREGDPMQPEYSYLREVDYCSGACLLVRKDIFQQLGLFDERYIPAYYEDSDLCIGIWGLGYKVVFQPDVVVFHNEFTSSSFNKATALMVANQSKFVAKRKDALRDKVDPSPNNVLFARDLRQGNRLLVIDDRVPTPYQGSGYPRAYHMLNFLGELGYKVTLFPLDNATPWQPYTNELQQLGIEVFYGDNLDFIQFARDRTGYYDLVLISRPHNMEKIFDIIKRFFSNAVLLYDAEAMFSLREILKAKIKGIKLKDEDRERMINGEMDLMNKADLIVTVSEHEKKIIAEKGNLNNIAVWGHPIDVKSPKNDFHERKDILFVGGFLASESPNEDAVLYFAKDVFPKLHEAVSCRFFITGLNPPDSIKKLSSSSVIVTGYVEDLREYYDKCRVFVVPHRYSAGISWKLQEAMSYGIPAVVSELTASQLDLTDGNEVLIAKNTDEFVQKIIKIYQDEKLWYQIQQNALKYIQRTCNSKTMKTALNEIVKNGLQTKKQRVW